jgi:hypothetical protein
LQVTIHALWPGIWVAEKNAVSAFGRSLMSVWESAVQGRP